MSTQHETHTRIGLNHRGFFAGAWLLFFLSALGPALQGCKVASTLEGTSQHDTVSGEMPVAENADLPPGRYLGYLKVPSTQVSYPLAVDLVARTPRGGAEVKMFAIVKVLHGGFGSFEYQTDYFPEVTYRRADKTLVFPPSPEDRVDSYELADVVKHQDYLRGKLKLTGQDEVGEFFVRWQKAGSDDLADQALLLDTPVQPLLTGTYKGQCEQEKAWLQVEALPNAQNPSVGSHENPWYIRGRMAQAGKGSCGFSADAEHKLCVSEHFDEGAFNPFTRQLTLKMGGAAELSCRFEGSAKVKCGSCEFEKLPDDTLTARSQFKLYPRPAPGRPEQRITAHSTAIDQYAGYLFHEQLNRQQRISLNLQTGVATLYFGSGSDEYIAYRVKAPKRSLGELKAGAVGAVPIVFEGPGEALLVMTQQQASGALAGVWFAKSFGRVGEFLLKPGSIGALPLPTQENSLVAPITGSYTGADWSISMQGQAGVSESAHDYYPIKLYGLVRPHVRDQLRYPFVGGIYNFYRGVIAFSLQEGSHFFGLTSRADAGGQVVFHRLPMPKGTSFVEHTAERSSYQRTDASGSTKVARAGRSKTQQKVTKAASALSPALEQALSKHTF